MDDYVNLVKSYTDITKAITRPQDPRGNFLANVMTQRRLPIRMCGTTAQTLIPSNIIQDSYIISLVLVAKREI